MGIKLKNINRISSKKKKYTMLLHSIKKLWPSPSTNLLKGKKIWGIKEENNYIAISIRYCRIDPNC
jgi:hypothetical protein